MKLGAPKQKYCSKNRHLMSKYRKVHPNGDTYCSACKLIRSKEGREKYPEKYKIYVRKSRIKKTYGITMEVVEKLFKRQHSQCAICHRIKAQSRGWHIDHDHKTNIVRGILCHKCNTAIGLLEDNTKIIKSALSYLSKAGKSKRK